MDDIADRITRMREAEARLTAAEAEVAQMRIDSLGLIDRLALVTRQRDAAFAALAALDIPPQDAKQVVERVESARLAAINSGDIDA
jgi:hypothetical protein